MVPLRLSRGPSRACEASALLPRIGGTDCGGADGGAGGGSSGCGAPDDGGRGCSPGPGVGGVRGDAVPCQVNVSKSWTLKSAARDRDVEDAVLAVCLQRGPGSWVWRGAPGRRHASRRSSGVQAMAYTMAVNRHITPKPGQGWRVQAEWWTLVSSPPAWVGQNSVTAPGPPWTRREEHRGTAHRVGGLARAAETGDRGPHRVGVVSVAACSGSGDAAVLAWWPMAGRSVFQFAAT
jgi:hypothetical protein